jgi:hypothetical protein
MWFLLVPLSVAWVEEMMAISAQIAMNELGSDYSSKLASAFAAGTDEFTRPAQAAAWSYYVERPPFNIPSFRHWHFRQKAINHTGHPIFEHRNDDDLWAGLIGSSSLLVKLENSAITRNWTFAFAAKVVMAQICDTYSPLHNSELWSDEFPDGDGNGASFMVTVDGQSMPLQHYWETGCGDFHTIYEWTDQTWAAIDQAVKDIVQDYPSPVTYDPATVMNTMHSYDAEKVYGNMKNKTTLTNEYKDMCRQKVRESMGLAGHAMADVFKKIDIPDFNVDKKSEVRLLDVGDSDDGGKKVSVAEIIAWVLMGLLVPCIGVLAYRRHCRRANK